jgi:hypothetical protein
MDKPKKLKNIKQLREELSLVLMMLKAEVISPEVAKEINNASKQITNTLKAEMQYSASRGEKPDIDFMNND